MNAPAAAESIFQECDFCKLQGVLGKSIVNQDGWYFCRPCLLETEHEMKKRQEMKVSG